MDKQALRLLKALSFCLSSLMPNPLVSKTFTIVPQRELTLADSLVHLIFVRRQKRHTLRKQLIAKH